MCLRGIAQCVAVPGIHAQHAVHHEIEEFVARGAIFAGHRDVRTIRRTAHRERAFLREQQQIDGWHVPRGIPVVHEHAERCRAIE